MADDDDIRARLRADLASALEADTGTAIDLIDTALTTVDDGLAFWIWQHYGERRGWCSAAVCATHDGIPSTPDEAEEWEAGHDPCEHVLRLWPSGPPGEGDG